MTIQHFDIAIVGGGPGGLALAQGLKKHGVTSVAVFEKDRVRADYVQGFRMRLRQRGLDALQANLPTDLFEIFLATLGTAPTENRTFDQNFEPLLPTAQSGEPEDTHVEKSVSRITLRQILLTGLEDQLHIGPAFTHYVEQPDGTVLAHFDDGSIVHTNLLIGADGAGSKVRRQLLPLLQSIDTGVRRLAGKLTLDAAAAIRLSPLLTEYNANIKPSSGHSLMVTSHRVDPEAYRQYGLIGADDETHRGIDGFHFNNSTSYVWWNTAYEQDELGSDALLETLNGSELLSVLLSRIADWHPELLKLIRHTDPSTVALLKVRSSVPGTNWAPGPVTLLGDAIHAMTYFRALGGNTALYDTGLLVPQLVAAHRGEKSLRDAVADYEIAMREHGYEAVRSSLAAMQRHVLAGRPLKAQAAE